jgi:two-component system, response regulator PdtaR
MTSPDFATILIVEDELIVAESLSLDLQRKGYAIAGIVSTGEEAINAASISQPDLILMDITLKGKLDGIETCKIIQQQQAVPVIFITAFSDRANVERAQQTGEPLHYLVKPIRLKDLTRRIEAILDSIDSPKAKSQSIELATELPSGFPTHTSKARAAMRYEDMDLSFFDIDNQATESSPTSSSSRFRA